MAAGELDPHWEWIKVRMIDQAAPVYLKGACNHLETVPVELLDGEVVGQLCVTCDGVLPPPAVSSEP